MILSFRLLRALPALLSLSLLAPLGAQLNYATPYYFTTITGVSNIGSADGTGSAARFNYPQSVAADNNGNVYVADSRNWTIRKISSSGVVTTLAGSPGNPGSTNGTGSAARFNGPYGVGVDAAGNVYVADSYAVRKITPAGVVTTLAGNPDQSGAVDGTGDSARFSTLYDLAVTGTGTVYVVEIFNHTVRKITPEGVVTTLAGLPGWSGSIDATGTAARFNQPVGVAVDVSGNVYVSDHNNSTIRKITAAGVVTTFAGSAGATGSADGNGAGARFNSPGGLGLDSSGNVFVADASNEVIRKITPSGDVTTVAGKLRQVGSADGNGTNASFYNPQDVAADATGNLYVADNYNHTIRKITASGAVTTLAGTGRDSVSSVVDGTLATAHFRGINVLALGADRTIYLADTTTIRKITPAGVVSTLAGQAGVSGGEDGAGTNATFGSVQGLAVDGTGNIYASDSTSNTIRKITPGGVVTTLAGVAGQSGTSDGTGSAARFNQPYGLALDSAGNLIVAEWVNGSIRKVTTTGVVTTIGGVAGQPGNVDGPAASARFAGPTAVAIDAAGNIFVADNACIRKIAPGGNVSTIAGELLPPNTSSGATTDGFGTTARLGQIKSIALDKSGNIFATGWLGGLVKKIAADSTVTTLAGTYGAGFDHDGTGADATFQEALGIALDDNATLYVSSPGAVHKGRLPGPPVITGQPQNLTLTAGDNVKFTVTADGAPDPTYQWYFNGGAFSGANGSTLSFTNARSTDAGDYTVVVTNSLGSVTSTKATLTVNTAVTPPSSGTGSSGSSGGGGGAPSLGFVLVLIALAGVRRLNRA